MMARSFGIGAALYAVSLPVWAEASDRPMSLPNEEEIVREVRIAATQAAREDAESYLELEKASHRKSLIASVDKKIRSQKIRFNQ